MSEQTTVTSLSGRDMDRFYPSADWAKFLAKAPLSPLLRQLLTGRRIR